MNDELIKIMLLDPGYKRFIVGFSEIGDEHGFYIQPFEDIEHAFVDLKDHQDSFNAVIISLSFSKGNYEGMAALHRIKKICPLLPVITIGPNHSELDKEKGLQSIREGAFTYLTKSGLDLNTLFQVLKVAVEQYERNKAEARFADLAREYTKKAPAFEKMLQTTELVLLNIFRDSLMFSPSVEMRIKNFDSFYKKILKKELAEGPITDPFTRFSDLAGLRVIFYNAADMDKAISLLLAANDFVDIKTEGTVIPDDKTKLYGYRAVHFDIKFNRIKRVDLDEYRLLDNVPLELQFKTIFAHSWSKIYHAVYKGSLDTNSFGEEQLNTDFKYAAKALEDIEHQITALTLKYHSGRKRLS